MHCWNAFLLAAAVTVPTLDAQETTTADRVLRALRLPTLATEARQLGVTDSLVRDVLDRIQRRGMPASDAEMVLEEEVEAVRGGGPKDNFGAFVRSQLDAGLRGRDLADAIHAEHQRRGIGRPDHARGRGRNAGANERGPTPQGERPARGRGRADSANRGGGHR